MPFSGVKKDHLAAVRLILSALIALTAAFLVYAVASGFPPEILGHTFRMKNAKGPVSLLVLLSLLRAAFTPEGFLPGLQKWQEGVNRWAKKPSSLWLLALTFGVIFTWQQITEYLSIKINFLPFSFYDYMLLNFFKGKIYFTDLLHGYYHANTALFLFAPLWKIFPDALLLILIYGPLAALAAFPLYDLTNNLLKENRPAALLTVLVYLNYRYLQNVLQMNFSIEILYPLFFFFAFAAALRKRWVLYYTAVLLGLCVKEDSFIYYLGFAGLVFFLPDPDAGRRLRYKYHGIATAILAAGYYFVLSRFILPMVGSPILTDVMKNFSGVKEIPSDNVMNIALGLLKNPLRIIQIYTDSSEKWATYGELLSRLCFIPLFSPAALIILAPLFPLFLHATGRDTDFVRLHYHYAAPVLPFVFIAFAFGLSNFLKRIPQAWRGKLIPAVFLALFLLNAGYFRTEKVTEENLKSILWAKSLPRSSNPVTHGHLLPYIGYQSRNYYLADPFELTDHPAHEAYMNAEYYLFDKNVNLYPWGEGEIDRKIEALKQDSRYEIMRSDDKRILFRLKESHAA